jgi:hypothetical protein
VDGFSILLPDFGCNKWWISEHEVKGVMKNFRNLFRLIEIVFEVVGIILAKFLIQLYRFINYIENKVALLKLRII